MHYAFDFDKGRARNIVSVVWRFIEIENPA